MLLFLLYIFFLFLKKIFFFFHNYKDIGTKVFMSEAIKENDIKLIIIFFFDFLSITFNFWNNMFELCLKYLL